MTTDYTALISRLEEMGEYDTKADYNLAVERAIEALRDLQANLSEYEQDASAEVLRVSKLWNDALMVNVELRAKLAEAERDARRYNFCQHWGFPVRNQTPHDADHRFVVLVDKAVYYGATPTFAIDAALATGEKLHDRNCAVCMGGPCAFPDTCRRA
jgi:hypothetical protein